LHLVGSSVLLYLIDDARSNKNQTLLRKRAAPFWVIAQGLVVISIRRFGTTCRSHL